MQPKSMENIGVLTMAAGAIFIALGGAYFYDYFQTLASAGASGSTSSALSIYNSTLGMPIVVTLAIFGLGFLVIGGFFVASAHITQQLVGSQVGQAASATAEPRPSKVCIKCGSLLYQNTPYCPNCGNPISRTPGTSQ